MKMQDVSLRGIKADPLAHELATSEGTKPYLDCLTKAYTKNIAGLEVALQTHCRTHAVGDDQGTRTAIPTAADFVADFPNWMKAGETCGGPGLVHGTKK